VDGWPPPSFTNPSEHNEEPLLTDCEQPLTDAL
jgi:hypothetical protein